MNQTKRTDAQALRVIGRCRPELAAMLECIAWYRGQSAGEAIAEILGQAVKHEYGKVPYKAKVQRLCNLIRK